MRPSQNCFNIVKSFEQCRLTSYWDSFGKVWTIGWGTIVYQNGNKVQKGDVITQQQADDLLDWQIDLKGNGVSALNININQNQYDSLVDFSYEEGLGALEGSALLKLIRANPNDPCIAGEFLKWDYAGGRPVLGILNRRHADAKLYFTPM